MEKKIKIACFSHVSSLGGAELAFGEMIDCLDRYELFVFGPGRFSICNTSMIHYVQCDLSWWFGPVLSFKSKIKLLKKMYREMLYIDSVLKEYKIDIVIVNTIASPVAAFAGRKNNIPVIWFVHEKGADLPYRLQFGDMFTKWLVGKLSNVVLCNSFYIYEHFSSYIDRQKMKVAYQSVSTFALEEKTHSDGNVLKIGIVGRLSIQKNQLFAVKALMPNDKLHIYLVGACEGEYASKVKSLCKELDCVDNVSFCGVQNDMQKFYQNIDVLLACGHNEALGRSVIEAMKAGLPVVAPKDCGYVEIIDHSISGFLYTADDEISLRNELHKLLDVSMRREIGSKAKEIANNRFNKINFQKQLVEVIDEIICLKKN